MAKQLKLSEVLNDFTLTTTPQSLSIKHLFIKNDNFEFDFDVKLSNGENLQRDYVWNEILQESFILSIIKDKQVPPIAVLIYDTDIPVNGKLATTKKIYRVIDGKQRLTTVKRFINNEFPIKVNGNEYYYKDFADDLVNKFHRYYFQFNVIYEYDDDKMSDKDLITWFNYINFAQVEQDVKHKEKLEAILSKL